MGLNFLRVFQPRLLILRMALSRLIHWNYFYIATTLQVSMVLVGLILSKIDLLVSKVVVFMKHLVEHFCVPHIWIWKVFVWTEKSNVLQNPWLRNLHDYVTTVSGLHLKWI